MGFDPLRLRRDFPVLQRQIHGLPLVYLDSAATSQKPLSVLDAMDAYYRNSNANIHRGVHALAEEATEKYEDARRKVALFINSPDPAQVIFTRNTTESINLVAYSWARSQLRQGDHILLTEMEHHSNLVPWQMLAAERGVILDFIPLTREGLLDLDAYRKLLSPAPRLVSISGMSNVLGTINPVREMIRTAHESGSLVLVDGAQMVPHIPVDVQALDVDFFVFSAHKMLGPTGIGILYGKRSILESMPPFMGGGDMIKTVHWQTFTVNDLPYKFEAGTPAIGDAIGFAAAIDYLNGLGMGEVAAHEQEIIRYALERLDEIPGTVTYGPSPEMRGGVVAFTIDGIHPHDVAQVLDSRGVAVRAGHHCAQPLHEKMGLQATSRASFYIYNSTSDVDALVDAIYHVQKLFGES